MIRSRLLIFLAIPALLAACRDEQPATEGAAASGEVLEGTISDAMLPLDTVRSQPPLAEPAAAARTRSDDGEDEAAEGEGAGTESAAEVEEAEEETSASGEDAE